MKQLRRHQAENKRCYVCNESKVQSCFSKKKSNPDGLQRICKECQKIQRKQYYDKNKLREFENHRKYEENNRQKINQKRAERRACSPDYYKKTYEYVKTRQVNSITYLIGDRARDRISAAFAYHNAKPKGKILDLLGCSLSDYKKYLETTFPDGLTWEDYRNGLLQIDHIVPCSCFELNDFEHQKACFHYKNTRLLQINLNVSKKHNRILSGDALLQYIVEILR
jgi:hypothetical protein